MQGINGADDTESWSSIGFETKLPYSIELELDQGFRLKDQMSSFKQTFTQVSIAYEIIDRMKKLRVEGLSCYKIAKILNDEKIKTKNGFEFFPATINKILQRWDKLARELNQK